MFEWDAKYSIGVSSVDAQHQNLFAIGRELHRAMEAGVGRGTAGRVLDRLVRYTAVHFAHEERLMRQHDYPDLAQHTAEHEAITGAVMAFRDEFRRGQTAINVRLLIFLKRWLEEHIAGSDRKMEPFLNRPRESRSSGRTAAA
jgi:hemerythrin